MTFPRPRGNPKNKNSKSAGLQGNASNKQIEIPTSGISTKCFPPQHLQGSGRDNQKDLLDVSAFKDYYHKGCVRGDAL